MTWRHILKAIGWILAFLVISALGRFLAVNNFCDDVHQNEFSDPLIFGGNRFR